ncbi:DUF3618 domain-containing protein [Dactylosporangium sp. CA-233914]|uniref:DUF3618 domain-containing protein n=1 Tax=Dactylosporangium sp. CA-233914 TaxID=3239934 RepID=UPI003D8D3287
MRTRGTPEDPDRLREEIARTRSDLAETAGRLAARTDVKSRAKQTAGDARQRVAMVAGDARQRVVVVTDGAKRHATAAATSVCDTVRDTHLPARARRPLPWAVIGAVVAAAGVVVYVMGGRRG